MNKINERKVKHKIMKKKEKEKENWKTKNYLLKKAHKKRKTQEK